MKFTKKSSLLLSMLLIGGSLVGCGQKVNYDQLKNETPILVHSDLKKEIKALEGENILDLYFMHNLYPTDETTAKISEYESKLTSSELELQKKYNNLYLIACSGLQNEEVKNTFVQNFNKEINDLLNKMYLNEGDELKITESFNKLNPVETMQTYLKDNNITVTSVKSNDDLEVDFERFPFVATLSYTIEGTIGKEAFTEVTKQSFFFSPEDKDVLEKRPQEVSFKLDGIQ